MKKNIYIYSIIFVICCLLIYVSFLIGVVKSDYKNVNQYFSETETDTLPVEEPFFVKYGMVFVVILYIIVIVGGAVIIYNMFRKEEEE